VGGLTLVSFTSAAGQDPGIIVAAVALPSADASYHGGTHVFLDGGARLDCGSHGGFTSSVDPPRAPGTTAIADYHATFTGELALDPPHASTAVVHPVAARAHMVERITFAVRRGDALVFDTELVAFDLGESGLPAGVLVRESPGRVSPGRATITTLTRGRHRVESYFDVWLEISLDGGRSWSPAAAAVRMSIGPEAVPRRGISAGG
jgi:hypothetical protein